LFWVVAVSAAAAAAMSLRSEAWIKLGALGHNAGDRLPACSKVTLLKPSLLSAL